MKKNKTSMPGKLIAGKKLFAFSVIILLFMFLPAALQAGTNWPQKQKLVDPSGNAFDLFGYALSLDGDLAIVGAPSDESAFIFKWDGNSFSQQQRIVSSDGLKYVLFGNDVCVSGDLAIVGCPSCLGKGAAYIFKWNGASWIQQQRLTASDGASGDYFGDAVAICGNYAIVGAYQDDSYRGSAYVFKYNGSSWVEQQKLTSPNAAANGFFGCSVAFSDDKMVIVGTWGEDSYRGAAYVFIRDGEIWSSQQKLTASDGTYGDRFGSAAAIESNRAIFGAYFGDNGMGSAYVFVRDGNSWSEQQKLIASDGAENDDFGISVSISGNHAIVGAYGDDSFTGSAYMFKWDGAGWVEEVKLTAPDRMENDLFGGSVCISGDLALAGSPYSNSSKGAVFVYKFCSGADLNGDCLTDFTDYAILANLWLYNTCSEVNGWCSGSDYDTSGSIDSLDLMFIIRHWLEDI